MMKANKKILVTALSVLLLAGCGQKGENSAEDAQQPQPQSKTSEPVDGTGGIDNKGKVYEGTISGVISDSMCKADHSGMGELGKDPVACTQKCVEGGAKYVLVDSNGEIYSLSDQKLKEHAGHKVTVSGHIDPNTKVVHVHSVAAQ